MGQWGPWVMFPQRPHKGPFQPSGTYSVLVWYVCVCELCITIPIKILYTVIRSGYNCLQHKIVHSCRLSSKCSQARKAGMRAGSPEHWYDILTYSSLKLCDNVRADNFLKNDMHQYTSQKITSSTLLISLMYPEEQLYIYISILHIALEHPES